MSDDPSHLVERVAGRLRGVGGLAAVEPVAVDPAPERDIRSAVRRDAERRPFIRRVTPRPAQGEAMGNPADDHAAAAPEMPAENGSVPDGMTTDGLPPDTSSTDGQPAENLEGEPLPGSIPRRRASDRPDEDSEPHWLTVSRRNIERTGRPDPADPGRSVSQTRRRASDGGALTEPAAAFALPETTPQAPLDMAALERAGLVVGHKVRTRISEEFRITVGHILRSLQTNYSPGRGSPNVLMVTSARPGEGKSFSTLNLAGSMAQHTQRDVLLVDVDAKQRSISVELGLGDRPGLLDMSTNPSLRVEDVIVRTAIPHLSVVPIGSGHTIGSEHTPPRPMSTLIERVARRFPNAIVLLDAPPCLSTSDPATLAPYVGQIVMVVEAEKTQRNEIVAALDLIKACPAITLMLNKIKLTTSYTFGAYHYFGTYN